MYKEKGLPQILPNPELVLLATLLSEKSFLEKPCVKALKPEDFQDSECREIFQTIQETGSNEPTLLRPKIKSKTTLDLIWNLFDLATSFLSPPDVEEHCALVAKNSLLRKFQEASALLSRLSGNSTASREALSKQATEIFQSLVLEETEFEPTPAPEKSVVFPVEVYPKWLQDYCLGLAESISCPLDFLGASVLTVASIAAGKKTKIELKPDWRESARLYMAIVGSPFSGKTPAMLKTMAPIFHREELFKDENAAKHKAFDAEKLKYEVLKENWKKEQKAGNVLATAPESAEESRYSRAYSSDFTVESLAPILADENDLILYHDELSEWMLKQNQYKGGKGGDKQFYLRAWSGTPCPVDRKGSQTLYISDPYISVLGGLVPENILLIKGDTHDGFIDRVLFAFPEPRQKKWSEYSLAQEIYTSYNDEINRIFRLPTTVLTLTKEAREIFVNWHDDLSQESFEETNMWISSSLGKLIGYTARFALILCLLENRGHCLVEKKDILGAIELARYFGANSKKVFQEIEKNQEQKEQDVILNYARKRGLEKVTCRELVTARIPGCKKAKEAREQMARLVDSGLAIWTIPNKEIKFTALLTVPQK